MREAPQRRDEASQRSPQSPARLLESGHDRLLGDGPCPHRSWVGVRHLRLRARRPRMVVRLGARACGDARDETPGGGTAT